MIQLNTIHPPKGAHKRRKIVGRGNRSGHGKTSCRGQKGQGARTGFRRRPGFEGGQMPYIRRVPKRGFHSLQKCSIHILNISDLLNLAKDSIISPDVLKEANILNDKEILKILSNGDIETALTVKTHKISQAAKEKIEKAGGKVELLTNR